MDDCAHRCCALRSNPYHTHTSPPTGCPRCAAADDGAWGEDGANEIPIIAARVLHAVAPQIPHLPAGEQLDELVHATTMSTYHDSMGEPQVRALSRTDRRRVIAARVGLTLAFPP